MNSLDYQPLEFFRPESFWLRLDRGYSLNVGPDGYAPWAARKIAAYRASTRTGALSVVRVACTEATWRDQPR